MKRHKIPITFFLPSMEIGELFFSHRRVRCERAHFAIETASFDCKNFLGKKLIEAARMRINSIYPIREHISSI